jgi:hypothetical protein
VAIIEIRTTRFAVKGKKKSTDFARTLPTARAVVDHDGTGNGHDERWQA